MSRYEAIVILDPALTEDSVETEIGGLREVVAKTGGELLEIQKWGKKRLAYEVKKRREGYYVLVKVNGVGDVVADLERYFRITETILKGMIVRADEPRGGRQGVESHATLEGRVATTAQEGGDGELQ